uniref:Uncharacterized protein n=1 Tax=Romanomermis culicivorax TaxID=13658 RepID=A0A915J3Q0_ROMCU
MERFISVQIAQISGFVRRCIFVEACVIGSATFVLNAIASFVDAVSRFRAIAFDNSQKDSEDNTSERTLRSTASLSSDEEDKLPCPRAKSKLILPPERSLSLPESIEDSCSSSDVSPSLQKKSVK